MGPGSPPSLPTDGQSSQGAGRRPLGCRFCGGREWRHALIKGAPRRILTKQCASCGRRWTGEVIQEEKAPKGDRILVLDYTKGKKGVI